MNAADYRDADGWVTSHDLARVIPRPARDAARVMRHRVGIVPKIRERKVTRYRLTDDQWQAVIDYGVELEVIGKATSKGWHASASTCSDGEHPIRLWYKVDPQGYPVAWQWREDSDREWVAPSVLTMREATDQLVGDHPVALIFRRKYAEQIRSL